MTSIRPLRPADKADWRRLWTGYLDFYGTSAPEEVLSGTFARLLPGGDPAMFALIAERDGAAVGLAHCVLHRHCWRLENATYLQDLFVDPAARGGGVGRALIEAVYAAADAAGAPAVWWLTQEFNYPGRMLYDRVGERTPFIRYNRPS